MSYIITLNIKCLEKALNYDLIVPFIPERSIKELLMIATNIEGVPEDSSLQDFMSYHLGLDKVAWQPPKPTYQYETKSINICDLGDIPLNMFRTVIQSLENKEVPSADIQKKSDKFEQSVFEQLEQNVVTNETSHKYICDSCHKIFKKKHHLESHLLIHSHTKPYTCQYCDKSFRQSGHLKLHIDEIHNLAEENVSCPKCNREFSSKRKLQYHVNHVHKEKKKFGCNICGKLFSRGKLKLHILRDHEKTLPFLCEVKGCQKRFVSPYYLKRHSIKHVNPS